MEKLSFDQRQEYLKGDSSLRKKWKNISQIGTLLKKTLADNKIASKQRIEQEIFDLFNEKEDNLYDFSTSEKHSMINGSMRPKRRYNDIETYKLIKSILSIRGLEKIRNSTYQNIIECIQEMRNLKEVLNTSKPQSDPSKLDAYPIKFLENGQGYFNFFPEEEVKEGTPPFSSHLGAVDMQSKDENSGDDDDNDDDDDDGYEYDRQRIHNK